MSDTPAKPARNANADRCTIHRDEEGRLCVVTGRMAQPRKFTEQEAGAILLSHAFIAVYDYTFTLWPDEAKQHCRPLYDVFRLINTRVELTLTAGEFAAMRDQLEGAGYTLRAVVRVPHHAPEAVV